MRDIMRRRLVLGAITAAALPPVAANEPGYPSKPIRWVVSYPAGGGADWFTRIVIERVSAILGQPILVDNRPGAAGTIALTNVAQSPADGYTVITGDVGTVALSSLLLPSLPYDPVESFVPVTLAAEGPWLWIVNSGKVPVKSFREFLEFVRKNPGKVSYGSFGDGSLTHVMTELLASQAGISMLHVPYKGAAPAQQDLIGGTVDAMFVPPSLWKSIEPSGRARALAVSSKTRMLLFPQIPSIAEEGVAKYEVSPWIGFMVPAKTPASIVEKLRNGIVLALKDPAVITKLVDAGYVITASTSADFRRVIKSDLADWAPVIANAKIKMK
jgi:tripartite-type tricarboxylate transporter receptor subunit TctC